MKTRLLSLVLGLSALVQAACTAAPPPVLAVQQLPSAQAVDLQGVENLHRVNSVLYRSGQPDAQGFSNLQSLGVRSVLNLREYHSDIKRAAHTNLQLLEHPMAAGAVTEQDVETCLSLLAQAPKPVLVHCWHGSDRTGIIVAAWRIVFEGYSVQAAEAEFRDDRFGHHEFWYGNLVELLRSTDWNAMRSRLQKEK